MPWGATTRAASEESYYSEDGASYVNWTGRDILIRARIQYGFVCGDPNGDESCNLGDAGYIINYIFYDGPDPDPMDAGDANADGGVNLGDSGYIINYIFYNGPEPVCP